MGYLGLEPRTNRLKADYSTIELATLSEILASVNKDVKVFLTNNFYFKVQYHMKNIQPSERKKSELRYTQLLL